MSSQEFRYSTYRAQLKGSKMAKLQEQVEHFSKKIEQENLKLTQLNTQIVKLEEDLVAKRAEQASKSRQRDQDPVSLARKNKGLQMKLDGIRQKQNNYEAENKRLKEQINQLRRERNLFNTIYAKLKDELNEKKDDLRKVISESNFAKQYIEQAQEELQDQQRAAFLEQRKFEKDFIEAPPALIQDQQKDHLTNGTARDFITSPPNKPSQNISIFNDRSSGDAAEPQITSTIPLKVLIQERKERIKEEEKQLRGYQTQVKEYEKIIEDLYMQTGCATMEEVVKTFREYEEENYILFRNVNQLDDEYETLQRQKKKLLEELTALQRMPKESKQDAKAMKMQSALKQIADAKGKKESLQQRYQQQYQMWEQVKSQLPLMHAKLGQLYASMGHEEEEFFEEEITMNNVGRFMSMMERLTLQILENHKLISSQRQVERRGAKYLEESNQSSGHVVSPANEDLDKALSKLHEEFQLNIERVTEERKDKQVEPKERFITQEEMREIAEKDFKKFSKRATIRKTTVQK